jgi:hypothetical protein
MTMAWALRNLLFRSLDESQSNGSDSQRDGDGDKDDKQGDDAQGDDDDADLKDMNESALLRAVKDERRLRKEKEREARTLLREKNEREKKERERESDEARKKGEWEKVAKDAETERDKEREKREALERSVIEDRKKNAIRFEAQKLSFHDPDEAVRLLDLPQIEVDDNNQPVGVQAAVKKLAEQKQHLVNKGGSDGMPITPTKQGDKQQYSASRSYIAQTYTPRKNS